MVNFHTNPETGMSGPCSASVKECRFKLAPDEHFSTLAEAQAAYEASQGSQTVTLGSTGAQEEAFRTQFLDLAREMDGDPDWLPPVDDPSKVDGDFEEEGFIDSMAAFKDPSIAMGNCITVAEAVAEYSSRLGTLELGVVEEEVGGPFLNAHAANRFEADGRPWVVDYTYSQIDPEAPFPQVLPEREWRRRVRAAGHSPAEEIRAIYARGKGDATDPETHWVQDNWGDGMDMEAGVLSDGARWVFRNGQCLGLAQELAAHFGTNRVAVHCRTEESDELLWDEVNNCPILDGDGQEQSVTFRNIVHAYAVDADGNLWDVDGITDREAMVDWMGEDDLLEEGESGPMGQDFEGYMSPQNRDFARSMIPAVLAMEESPIGEGN